MYSAILFPGVNLKFAFMRKHIALIIYVNHKHPTVLLEYNNSA